MAGWGWRRGFADGWAVGRGPHYPGIHTTLKWQGDTGLSEAAWYRPVFLSVVPGLSVSQSSESEPNLLDCELESRAAESLP